MSEQNNKQTSKKKGKKQGGGNVTTVMRKGPTEVKISGNGKYSLSEALHAAMSVLPKGTFKGMGAAAGGALGGPAGAALGAMAGQGLSWLTGYGEYVLNDIVSKQGKVQKPDPNIGRRIVHSEFITDVATPAVSTFNVGTTLTVNPGDTTVFPWLAPIAQRFAKYKFIQLVFEFRSTTSEYSSTPAMGSIILAPNYNPVAPPPGSKAAMESMTGAISSKPSNSLLMGVECNPRNGGNPERWVRNPSVNTPTQLTDLCDVYVATSGLSSAANTVLGELWVHYTVDLYEPYYAPTAALATPGSTVLINSASAPTTLACFGNIGGSVTVSDSGVITGLSSYVLNSYVGAPPSTVNYVMSVDTGTPGRLWFGRPGTYLFTCKVNTSTAFTSQTGACWTYLFSDSSAILGKPYGASENGANTQVVAYHLITIKQANTSLQYTYNAVGWGAAPSIAGGTLSMLTVLS